MQDLKLWRELDEPSFPTPMGTRRLQGLADLPLAARSGFFAALERLAQHPRNELRKATYAALGGAQGSLAWRRLIAGLNDDRPLVQEAAVRALHQSAQGDPARWAHALFHADAQVRAAATELGAPPGFQDLFPLQAPYRGKIQGAPTTPPEDPGPMESSIAGIINGTIAYDQGRQSLLAYLERGSEIPLAHRLAIADFLVGKDLSAPVLPLLIAGVSAHLRELPAPELHTAARSIAILGTQDAERKLERALVNRSWTDADQPTLTLLMTEAATLSLRRLARDYAHLTSQQSSRLTRLALTLAWGVRLGQFLTGERFRIEMLVADADLGHTRLCESKLHINPLPILRGLRNGQDVVRGLIIHEFGHHLFHKGKQAEAVWQQADDQGMGRLLNLVADEHLERNLRQRSSRYGNMLKTLNAFAFQHNAREVAVANLCRYLGSKVYDVLSQVPLGAARKPGHVVVGSGRLLREMEGAGHSFACFVRALRMGLGNRSGDPKVAEALALFSSGFRKSEMPDLLEVARRLREIFGDETDILNDFGLERLLAGDEADWLACGPIEPEDIQRQVQTILDTEGDGARKQTGTGWGLNMGKEETFRHLDKVQKLPHHPDRHAQYARQVARAARQLARYFQDLGLASRPQRRRVQGRQLDRTRLRDLLLKSDPRILVARKVERTTDLFLGVAIDCSGSMAGNKLEKAKLFATLLAEALRGQRGIDLRLFGFTDFTLFDVGDQRRCAVHDLQTSGGNNDAAALWHLARLARTSHRRARLLVMISDGLPTACTVSALRGLVQRLTRQQICCAQVAVQKLAQVCFPHYVLLEDEDFDAAVRKFGEVVIRLVSQVIGSSVLLIHTGESSLLSGQRDG